MTIARLTIEKLTVRQWQLPSELPRPDHPPLHLTHAPQSSVLNQVDYVDVSSSFSCHSLQIPEASSEDRRGEDYQSWAQLGLLEV